MEIEKAFKNAFMYRVAVQQRLVKKGLESQDAAKVVLKNIDFVHEAYQDMQNPEDAAICIS